LSKAVDHDLHIKYDSNKYPGDQKEQGSTDPASDLRRDLDMVVVLQLPLVINLQGPDTAKNPTEHPAQVYQREKDICPDLLTDAAKLQQPDKFCFDHHINGCGVC
jgi:hypothetical protein